MPYDKNTYVSPLVLEHATEIDKHGSSTGQGLDFLGLEHVGKNFAAANLYIDALKLIIIQQNALKSLQQE